MDDKQEIVTDEKYVLEKYESDEQTPENLIERITIHNDKIIDHWTRGGN